MTHLQPFVYEGQDVRTLSVKGEPWWVLKDVCDVLDLSNARMIADRLDSDDVSLTYITDSLGRQQQTNIINESGLYSVILRSDKPEAKAFKRWVTHEVLPQIRKTGGYNLPRTLPDALRLAADLAEENEKLKPKAEMHDLFLSAANAQPMGDVAKALGVGRNSLFKVLREARVLMYNNTPYQRFIDRGYFEVIEKPIVIGESTINKPLTLVTPKGIDYIGRMLKEGHHEISAYS